ncbi:MAG: hypothetical protein DYG89_16675 [Caldilinea sp. CFX5]|nr:hypothetical protein [Caldilinea sp. CFX5]
MLASTHTKAAVVGEKAALLGRSRSVTKSYFCPNSACLADEISAHAASSFANVWLVTDEEIGSSWLMMADKPTCPQCGSTLVATHSERAEVVLPLM